MRDAVIGFPAVAVDGVEIVVDQRRPVAAIVRPGHEVRLVTWPSVDVGLVEPLATLIPGPDGAWVHYPPATVSSMDDSHEAVLIERDSPAVQVRPDGSVSVVRLGTRRAIGATSGLLWSAPTGEQHIDETYRGGAMPEGWEDPTVLTLMRPDGSQSQIRVDRYVFFVFEEDGLVHLVLAPTPPVAVPEDGSVSFNYRISEITLPADLPFPDRLHFLDHHPDGIGPAVEPRRCWWTPNDYGLPTAPVVDVDLADEPDTHWTQAPLTEEQIRDATTAAADWFGDPNAFWHGDDGSVGPLADGIRDAEVHLEDEWPRTRVVVTFLHPYWTAGRLRRSVRVFDDAGRLTTNPYADIYLMEDLDTRHLPPSDAARDGYLDI